MGGYLNPAVDRTGDFRGLFSEDEYRDVQKYFARHPELTPTPLEPLPTVAAASEIFRVDAKDETGRFGLNAFKIIGVLYAVERLDAESVEKGLVCATAGNHGRAVARVARQKSVPCTVFIPRAGQLGVIERATRSSRVAAMQGDGARVIEVDGGYETAVAVAARHADKTGATIVSDTSWDGYQEIPRRIMAGYTRLFEEAHTQWEAEPDLVLIQGGVGGLVCAAASWFAFRFGPRRPFLIACEPENAACLLESARAGHPAHVEGHLDTILAGLRCADPSPAAWPAIARGIDAFVTVDDQQAIAAMELLANDQVTAGPSGACGAAAVIALGSAPQLAEVRKACALDRSTRALIVVTEGA